MRLSLIPLAALAIATTPLSAQTAAPRSAEQPTCAASLQKVEGAAGYKMVRDCGKATASKKASSLAVSREPVTDGSELVGAANIGLGLFVAGVIAAILINDDDDGDGGGGTDPASP
jgi:hypothetical protein